MRLLVPRLAALPAFLLLLACAAPAAGQGKTTPAGGRPTVSFTAPNELNGFRLADRMTFDQPELGTRLRYERGGGPVLDVYVYPAPRHPSCAGGCDSVAVHGEADGFGEVIPMAVQRGMYDSLRIVTDERVEMAGLRGRHLRMKGAQAGRPVASHLYVLGAGELLLKVRSTYAPDAATDTVVAGFIRGFAAGLPRRAVTACAVSGAPAQPMSMSVRLDLPPAEVARRVEEALARFGYGVAEPRRENAWRTLPVTAWPARETWGMFHDRTHPGLELLVTSEAAAGGTTLAVTARTLCATPKADDGSGIALAATLELMAELMGEVTEGAAKKP